MAPSKSVILAAVGVLACSAAHADGVADGNAGLQALDKGAYDQAITLFTRALADRRLAGDDREFAYLSRGKAHLAKGEQAQATADFKAALQLKPADQDARDALQQASVGGERSKSRWGYLALLAGKYWAMNPAKPTGYARADWDKSGKALIVQIVQKSLSYKAKYQLDPAAGVIFIIVAGNKTVVGDVDVEDNKTIETSYIDSVPTRETVTVAGPGQFTELIEQYRNGAWATHSNVPVQEVSKEAVAAVRWAKKLVE